jgi:putative flippase GtrA
VISSKTYIALTKFALVGGFSFFIDLSVYYLLSQTMDTVIAKSLGIVLATWVNYQLNKRWTWGQKNKNKDRFARYIALYTFSGILNVLSNEIFLSHIPIADLTLNLNYPSLNLNTDIFAVKINKFFAVIFATAIGMMINFIGQKIWVFKEKIN